MGSQVQENLRVPTCYPGLVYVRGAAVAPKKSKWDRVSYKENQVQVDKVLVGEKKSFKQRPHKVNLQHFDHRKIDEIFPCKLPDVFTHCLAGIGCSGCAPMVSANVPYNDAKALCGRAFLAKKEQEWGVGPAPSIWEWAKRFIDELLPDIRTKRMNEEDWIDSMPSRRRKALRIAAVKYHRAGWKKSFAEFKAFVKKELLPGFSKRNGDIDRLTEMIDRLIQAPHDVTHLIAGTWLKPLVKELKRLWTVDGPIFYGSAGPEDLHHFLQKLVSGAAVYFWCDFSMFDCTHSQESWSFMRELYKRAGIDDAEFWKVMDAWERPSGRIGAFKYKARILNASGRDDTALANGVLNGVATFLSSCAAWLEKPLCTLTVDDLRACRSIITLSVCGDDSIGKLPLMSHERQLKFRDDMLRNIAMFGFEAKFNMSERLSDAVYLGMRPYPTKAGWFWGKTIGRATYKMGWVRMEKSRDEMAHITGIAEMHRLCSSHVPILSDLAERILALREGAKRTPVELDPNRPWEWTYKSGVQYDELTLQAVADAYTVRPTVLNPDVECDQAVSLQDVNDLIAAIRGITQLPCVLDHWLWRRMILADEL